MPKMKHSKYHKKQNLNSISANMDPID